ncbi:glycosyltransferase family 2 protein [Spirosoma koreense]
MKNQAKEFTDTSGQTMPMVSLITATYNAEKYLDACISSVLNQEYKNFEYIIIDGGSTDKTVTIIKQYEAELAYWVSEPDKGIYDAWNKGLARAKGDWIAFIGADDLLYPDALSVYVNHILQHPNQYELEFISSRLELINEDLSLISVVGTPWVWQHFKRQMNTWHVGAFHARHLFDKYGFFNTLYKVSGDYELLLRPKDKLITSYIDHITAKMRVGGISNLMLSTASYETYHAKMKNGAVSILKGQVLRIIDQIRLLVRRTTRWKNF